MYHTIAGPLANVDCLLTCSLEIPEAVDMHFSRAKYTQSREPMFRGATESRIGAENHPDE